MAENQCDGCARGLPVGKWQGGGGICHVDERGRAVMACTADRYEDVHPKELDAASEGETPEWTQEHSDLAVTEAHEAPNLAMAYSSAMDLVDRLESENAKLLDDRRRLVEALREMVKEHDQSVMSTKKHFEAAYAARALLAELEPT